MLNAAAARSTQPVRGTAAGICPSPNPNRARVSPHTRVEEEEEEEECFSVSSFRLQEEKCWSSGTRDDGAESEERSCAAASAAAAAAARGDGHRSGR